MIYRLLGGVSMFVGAAFGLIALAVLIPFLNTFSGSLLILVAVFGIVAWVFLAIGWQLLRPPKRRRTAEEEATWEPGVDGVAGEAEAATPREGPAFGGAEGDEVRRVESAADEEPLDVAFESGFSTFDVAVPPAEEGSSDEGDREGVEETAGRSIDERLTETATTFKKPYQAPEEGDRAGG